MEGGVASDELQQLCNLSWCGWPHLGRLISGRGRVIGDVLEYPGPALRLAERRMKRRVNASNSAHRQRLAIDPPAERRSL